MSRESRRIQRIERLLHAANQRRIAGGVDISRQGQLIRGGRTIQLEVALFEALDSVPFRFIVEINGRTYILDHTHDYIHGPYEVHRP